MASISYCGRCLSTFAGDPEACPNLGCGGGRPDRGWGTVLGEGDVLDRRYRVERCLAVGGAGLTYLGQEIDVDGKPLGPRVAIKVLYAARASGPFLRRLSNEAQILQELAHENIVELLGFVHRAGHEPYLVTRFEEGGSLAQHVERHAADPGDWALKPPVAAAILRQVLLGLDVAHQRGVVHRDLKPDNVLLDAPVPRDGVPRIRVADFGIAKVAGGMVGDRLTRMGAFVGTPEYAAPEQFEGLTPTPATDVFAAGGLFVYLLTGRPPFTFTHRADIASTYEELVAQVPIPMSRVLPAGVEVAPDVARAVEEVIGNTLVIDPERRYTIHQVLAALAPLIDPAVRGTPVLNTIDVTTSRLMTPRASVPPASDAGDAPPPPPRTLASSTALRPPAAPPQDPPDASDTPPAPPPTVAPAGAPEGGDTALGPPPLPPPPPAEPPSVAPPGRTGGDDDASADATEEAAPAGGPGAPDEDDATVEAPSDAPPAAVPLTGPPSYVGHPSRGVRLGARSGEVAASPAPPTAIPDDGADEDLAEADGDAPEPASPEAPSAGRPVRPTAEVPEPPPFVPSLPPQPAPALPAPEPAPRSGGTAGLAGCFGLSLVGMAAVGTGGFLVVALVLVGVAAATGWFSPGPPATEGPVVIDDQDPPRFTRAHPLPEADRERVERAVRRSKDELARCGKGTVRADLLVATGGEVVYAKVAPEWLGTLRQDCVRRALERVTVPRGVTVEGIARVEIGI